MDHWEPAEGGLERIVAPAGWIYRDRASGSICHVPHPQLLQSGARLPALRQVPPADPPPARKAG